MREHPAPAAGLPPATDVVLAGALTAFVAVTSAFASQGQPERHAYDAVAVALIVIAGGGLAVRRRFPVTSLLVVFGAVLAYQVAGYAQGSIWLMLIWAYCSAVLHGAIAAAVAVAVVGFAVIPWLDRWLRDGDAPELATLLALASWLIVLLGGAQAVRVRRLRRAEAERLRAREQQHRASEERLRIARELHDALGHHLSLISVQAGVALHVHDDLPDEVRGSLSAIRLASTEALTELRSVLEILRQDGERAPRSPTSTLARLDELVDRSSTAGLDVRASVEGEVRALPFGVDVAAYRVVQEALTNVTRHARGGAASVDLTYGDDVLTVRVEDDGAGPPGGWRPGTGLTGMRERLDALGGELEAGPGPRGGFRVVARFPLDPVPAGTGGERP
jgi:signal transduction histidine kinase